MDSVCGGLVVDGCPTRFGPKFKSHSESFEAAVPNQGKLMDHMRASRTVDCVLGCLHVTIDREVKPQKSGCEPWQEENCGYLAVVAARLTNLNLLYTS